MTAAYVRHHYRVPAKRGMRVRALGMWGTIVSFPGAYLGIRLDGERRVGRYHPTWRIEYPCKGETMSTSIMPGNCAWCPNTWHLGPCPRVKAITYEPGGAVRYEFWPHAPSEPRR